jgi:hypothetical protein
MSLLLERQILIIIALLGRRIVVVYVVLMIHRALNKSAGEQVGQELRGRRRRASNGLSSLGEE